VAGAQACQNLPKERYAAGDLDGADLQRLFIDTDVDLAPQTAFRATMLAGVPLAFARAMLENR